MRHTGYDLNGAGTRDPKKNRNPNFCEEKWRQVILSLRRPLHAAGPVNCISCQFKKSMERESEIKMNSKTNNCKTFIRY